ncbi:MAG TPA: acylphosphatase [Vicinamibacterales bacterium]|nr:acylphosphatase [Vicinamibacterales bacterium]
MSDLHVRVTGVVQGVGFRWFVRERARRLGLAGWVRNLPDGSLEVLASGEQGQIDLLMGELHKGPPGAVVDRIHQESKVPEHALVSPFGIIKA